MTSDGPTLNPEPNASIAAYADELWQAHRRLAQGTPAEWRAVLERGLKEAYRLRDFVGLALIVQAVVGVLDAEGRFDAAATEIDYAESLGGNEPNALAMLAAMRAYFLAVTGDIPAALGAVAQAEEAATRADLNFALAKARASCAVVRCVALIADSDRLKTLMGMGPENLRDADGLFLMTHYIPYLFALGERAQAHRWIRTLRLEADAADHRYRLDDAAVFEAAEDAIEHPLSRGGSAHLSRSNWLARWRHQALRYRSTLLRRDFPAAEQELATLLRRQYRAGKAALDIGGFEAYLRAQVEAGTTSLVVPLPSSVHLLNLGSTLAAGEAVALAGSSCSAASWGDWLDTSLPTSIRTALEWPVSRARIRALLAFRSGDLRTARSAFEESLEWCRAAGYSVELATTKVQFAELLRRHGSPRTERLSDEMRREGWSELRTAGIDAAPVAYAAVEAESVPRGQLLDPRLTARELEVLSLLARGQSYRQIADVLGVRWPTVQTLAHRCYRKLGVSGKVKATEVARDHGLI
jgi:DNA-binding CsgD family transcriptional regulator